MTQNKEALKALENITAFIRLSRKNDNHDLDTHTLLTGWVHSLNAALQENEGAEVDLNQFYKGDPNDQKITEYMKGRNDLVDELKTYQKSNVVILNKTPPEPQDDPRLAHCNPDPAQGEDISRNIDAIRLIALGSNSQIKDSSDRDCIRANLDAIKKSLTRQPDKFVSIQSPNDTKERVCIDVEGLKRSPKAKHTRVSDEERAFYLSEIKGWNDCIDRITTHHDIIEKAE